MINSKALKDYKYTDPDELPKHRKALYYLKRWFWKYPLSDIRTFCRKANRAYQFAKFSWNNYDWDMSYVYKLMRFKLQRVYKALENGHALQDPQDMAALRELIRIMRRLDMHIYENKYFREHDKKYGKLEHKNVPEYDENGKIKWYRWESWRTNVPQDASEALKKEERDQTRICYERAEKDRCADIDKMAELLKRHARAWWD